VIAGQGTATLELLEDARAMAAADLDAVLIPVGGGGLLGGACIACAGRGSTAVVAVEPRTANAMTASLGKGTRVKVPPSNTIADGLRPVEVGTLNFALAKAHVRDTVLVDDTSIERALVQLLVHAKLLVEPSGATALAAALDRLVPGSPRRIGVILSGGNIAPSRLREILGRVTV
jgi:threonine dehydratase